MAATASTAAWLVPTIVSALGAVGGAVSGSAGSRATRRQFRQLTAPFGSKKIQKFLPWYLRTSQKGGIVEPFITSGLQQIGQLIAQPGTLSPTVAPAIAQRLAVETERISRGTAGEQAEAAGEAARTGTSGTGIAQALQRAIAQAGQRQIGQARREALGESDRLRRADIAQTYDLLNLILSFINSGRGIAGTAAAGQASALATQSAGNQAMLAGLLGALGNVDWSNVYAGQKKGPG